MAGGDGEERRAAYPPPVFAAREAIPQPAPGRRPPLRAGPASRAAAVPEPGPRRRFPRDAEEGRYDARRRLAARHRPEAHREQRGAAGEEAEAHPEGDDLARRRADAGVPGGGEAGPAARAVRLPARL